MKLFQIVVLSRLLAYLNLTATESLNTLNKNKAGNWEWKIGNRE
ncbi:hypothetical protein A45J_0358 [hot springs metagenome]|uniref:Uncharacterized protein n=1 Tax=hot springs metagenome TaxID=433727 RepID=A0A5J4L1D9_9ZZZZ